MALDATKNFAKGQLATGVDSAATTLTLVTGHGARFPQSPEYNITVYNYSDYSDAAEAYWNGEAEIMRVTDINGDILTVTRAQEGTAAVNLDKAGKIYNVMLGVTEKTINDIKTYGEAPYTNGLLGDSANKGDILYKESDGTWKRLADTMSASYTNLTDPDMDYNSGQGNAMKIEDGVYAIMVDNVLVIYHIDTSTGAIIKKNSFPNFFSNLAGFDVIEYSLCKVPNTTQNYLMFGGVDDGTYGYPYVQEFSYDGTNITKYGEYAISNSRCIRLTKSYIKFSSKNPNHVTAVGGYGIYSLERTAPGVYNKRAEINGIQIGTADINDDHTIVAYTNAAGNTTINIYENSDIDTLVLKDSAPATGWVGFQRYTRWVDDTTIINHRGDGTFSLGVYDKATGTLNYDDNIYTYLGSPNDHSLGPICQLIGGNKLFYLSGDTYKLYSLDFELLGECPTYNDTLNVLLYDYDENTNSVFVVRNGSKYDMLYHPKMDRIFLTGARSNTLGILQEAGLSGETKPIAEINTNALSKTHESLRIGESYYVDIHNNLAPGSGDHYIGYAIDTDKLKLTNGLITGNPKLI